MFCKCFGNGATGFSFALLEIVNFILSSHIFFSSDFYIYSIFFMYIYFNVFLFYFTYWFIFHQTLFSLLHSSNCIFFEKSLSFAWLKERNKMFVLYLRNFSLIKYIQHKNVQMKCGEPFYKMIACLHVIQRICYFYFATFWLGALYTFEIWYDWTFP